MIFVVLTWLFLVSLLITTLHNRWMSGAMIAVSRCLYVVKSDIFEKIFARFNGKLLASGIWVISILYIIPVFLEVHIYLQVIHFQNLLFFHQLTKVINTKCSIHWSYTVAYTIDCVCSKMLDYGLNHGLFLLLFKLIPCTIQL